MRREPRNDPKSALNKQPSKETEKEQIVGRRELMMEERAMYCDK